MSQILMLQSVLRAWRAGEAGRMFEAGRRYSDAPVAGVSLGPVDTAVLARLVSEGFARDDAATVSMTGEPVAPGGFVRGGAPLGPARPALNADGTLINLATSTYLAGGRIRWPLNPSVAVEIPDAIWSWWSGKLALYDSAAKRIVLGVIARSGTQYLVEVSLAELGWRKIPVGVAVPDDHNAPAPLYGTARKPKVLVFGHGEAGLEIAVRTGSISPGGGGRTGFDLLGAPAALPAPGGLTSYGQFWDVSSGTGAAAKLVVATRVGDSVSGVWWMYASADYGETWGSGPIQLTTDFPYVHFAYGLASDFRLYLGLTNNGAEAGNGIYLARAGFASGSIVGPGGSIQNMYSGGGAGLSKANTYPVIPDLTGENRVRLLDVSNSGDCLVARYVGAGTSATTCTYSVMRQTTSTSGVWVEEPVCSGGHAIGYYSAMYVGGGVFDGRDDLLLCREDSGNWCYERWRRGGANGWAVVNVLLSRSAGSGEKLARPIVPVGAAGLGISIVQCVRRYAAGTFTDYSASAMVCVEQ